MMLEYLSIVMISIFACSTVLVFIKLREPVAVLDVLITASAGGAQSLVNCVPCPAMHPQIPTTLLCTSSLAVDALKSAELCMRVKLRKKMRISTSSHSGQWAARGVRARNKTSATGAMTRATIAKSLKTSI